MITIREMISFEQAVAVHFQAGKIRAPVHLSGGNELELHQYFSANVKPDDYVCTGWRSHFHCLLKGVPVGVLMLDILAGKSITLNYPTHRIVSSAIVGGIAPIATGLALAIKLGGGHERVHCFLGDMSMHAGVVHESLHYALGHNLPVTFVCEDNGMSVLTPTHEAWGTAFFYAPPKGMDYYHYNPTWPHQGTGKRVEF